MQMIGSTIHDRYRLDNELGRGGMGVVYRGYDTLLERDVAIKVLSESGLGSAGRGRLLNEARAVAQLDHPNITPVYDAGEENGASFIVMQYIAGNTLFDRPPETTDETIQVAIQICNALQHAHAHGIIHRDLKPENVLITPDGTAKLTDFGLARSVSSRMSSAGTIVGTVFYLAPEQALGQDFDGRADLYALGVMLYEMTSGRLPFTADDPLAVISQHINSPVVPPRAHNEEIPLELDSIIVKMLNKDPEDRPPDAAEVKQALEKIRSAPEALVGAAVEQPSDQSEFSVLDRIVRGRLFGREVEISQARSLWEQAIAAEGQLLLISGEPGIGKSRLMREITTQLEISGGKTYVGECYAEGGAPYEPVTQIVRKYFGENPSNEPQFPDFVLADLITLVPSIRRYFPDVPPNPPLDPQAEQYRLFENMVAFCSILSEHAPLLLALEDVHWADSGTLSILRHLARRTRRLRLMIIATYREMELDQYRPFQNVLLDLNRERLATRMKLTRLDRHATAAMLQALFSEEITPNFLEAIYRETEGNPFFIEEVCKALVESGELYYADGEWHRTRMEELVIPQSVRVAIQARIGNLPGDVQETLTLGAIIGREFDFDTLTTTSLHDEDSLIIALETAERAQLIEEISGESGGTFNFVHALIPSTLTESISGLRRRRLHRSVAEAICHQRPGDCEALAYHYIEGGDLVNGLEYSLKAAEKARNVHSIEEATRYYERAAEIAESLERPQQLLTIYEEIGRLQSSSNELRAVDAFLQALELTQFPEKRAQLKSSIGAAYASIGDERGLPYLEQAVDELNPESQANALALAYSSTGRFHHYHGRHKKGLTFLERALQIAEPLGDVSVLTIIYANLAGLYQHLANYEQSISWAQRLITLGEQIEFPPALALGYEFLAEDYFVMGEYQQALEAALKNHELGERYGMLSRVAWADFSLEHIYYGTGNLSEALSAGESSLELALTTGDIRLAIIAEAQLAIIKADLGDLEEAGEIALSSMNRMGELDQIFLLCSSLSAMVYWHLQQGDIQAALEYLERCDCAAAETDSRQVPLITGDIQAEVLLYTNRIDEALQIVEQQLQVSRDAPSRIAESHYLRVLAQIHAAQGNWEQSEITFDRAAKIQSEIGARLFLGQTLYYRGLMQLERGEQETALVDLQHAQEVFEECGANLWGGKARAAIK